MLSADITGEQRICHAGSECWSISRGFCPAALPVTGVGASPRSPLPCPTCASGAIALHGESVPNAGKEHPKPLSRVVTSSL